MKEIMIGLLTTLMLFLGSSSASAQHPSAKYSAKEIYNYFNQFSPQEIVDLAREGVQYFSEYTSAMTMLTKNQEEEKAAKLLSRFHPSNERFNLLPETNFTPLILLRCDEFRIVAHPYSAFLPTINQLGFVKQYKDAEGKKIGLELCERVFKSDYGIWGFQNQWWPMTDKPLSMGVFTTNIPNSVYQIQIYYPTNSITEDELNNRLISEQ